MSARLAILLPQIERDRAAMHLDALKSAHRRDALLRWVRRTRWSQGLVCPRCNARTIQRWGWFSGRQRYRCTSCQRTFSDLTATPVAFSKKLERWPLYCDSMARSLSVRAAAARSRINPSTSFRWRHAILFGLNQRDPTMLTGIVELDSVRFLHSEKGSRKLSRPARRRGTWHDLRLVWKSRQVTVTVARDRAARVFAAVIDSPHVRFYDLLEHFLPRLKQATLVFSERGEFSPASVFARRAQIEFVNVRRFGPTLGETPRDGEYHIANVIAYVKEFQRWLVRFRGVATRYLKNYLVWYRTLHRRIAAERAPPFQHCALAGLVTP